jgi:hypothetical protein
MLRYGIVQTTDERVSGDVTMLFNMNLDTDTFQGPFWGTYTIELPDRGAWEGSVEGKAHSPGYWTYKVVLFGSGDFDGLQIRADGVWRAGQGDRLSGNILQPGRDPVVLPGVAHNEGVLGTIWRTALSLHFPGPGAGEAIVEWLPYGGANMQPMQRHLHFSTGESFEVDDVVSSLFGATGSGSLRITSVGPAVVASARTSNEAPLGTFGQAVAPWRWDDGLGSDYEGWLVGLADSADAGVGFRTNVALQNLWMATVEVEVVFRDAAGQELGRRQTTLRGFEGVQWFRPLAEFAPGGVTAASALVRVVSGDGRVAAYASKVDNRTGDAVQILAFKLPAQ